MSERATSGTSDRTEENLSLQVEHTLSDGNRRFSIDVKTEFPAKGVTAIFGHSGAGKSTLLRCIAGLEPKSNTTISQNGEEWFGGRRHAPPHRRHIGYVFQEPLLFPHLDVNENLAFAEKRSNVRAMNGSRFSIAETCELLDIGHLLRQKPRSLSGGEKQRVSIARALVARPKLLLMDEPLSSLDESLKSEILPYLESIEEIEALPILYVSHSPREIARLAKQVIYIEHGCLIASGSASEVLSSRANLGSEIASTGVIVDAVVTQREPQWQLLAAVCSGGKLWLSDSGEKIGTRIRLYIDANHVSLMTEESASTSIQNRIRSTITSLEFDDRATGIVHLLSNDTALKARITRRAASELKLAPGREVWALVKTVSMLR